MLTALVINQNRLNSQIVVLKFFIVPDLLFQYVLIVHVLKCKIKRLLYCFLLNKAYVESLAERIDIVVPYRY